MMKTAKPRKKKRTVEGYLYLKYGSSCGLRVVTKSNWKDRNNNSFSQYVSPDDDTCKEGAKIYRTFIAKVGSSKQKDYRTPVKITIEEV